MKIILASESPRRKKLLEDIGLRFEVIPSHSDEDSIKEKAPGELVRKLAALKAMTVSNRVRQPAIVIGADTIVFVDGNALGKPRDPNDARRMLRMLSGREHKVFTGVCVLNNVTGKMLNDFQVTIVKFRPLLDSEIEKCVSHPSTMTGAGAYVPETHPLLFDSIDGSYTNVLGLPMEKAIPMLRDAGVKV